MTKSLAEQLYALAEHQYFESGDFNGLPIYQIKNKFAIESDEFREVINYCVSNEIVTARFHGNTHILMFEDFPSKDAVLEMFKTEDYPAHICIYPHKKRLADSPNLLRYRESPYRFELAKGAGQLDYRTFDLSVLEYYRNDPRYSYESNSIQGRICIKDEFFESNLIPESDQILLKTFGFAYDDDMNRYVAVFLRYLADLSPEHQKIWAAKEVKGNIGLHPDYYGSSINGEWGTRLSIFDAFVEEVAVINKMSEIIGRPHLFRDSFDKKRIPGFGFLLRPTEAEFNSFVLLLDKMMSDNIERKFFLNDVDLEVDEVRSDGKITVRKKGSIQILEAWVNKFFKPVDRTPIDEMIKSFKHVRHLRQSPAHKIAEDKFDQEYFKRQRSIISEAYDALRTLRLILSNHPKVKATPPQMSDFLKEGKIWDV